MKCILILFHCESNTGFAIGPLEATFFKMALTLCDGDVSRIHFGYPSMDKGPSETLPAEFNQYVILDVRTTRKEEHERAQRYIAENNIDTIFGFDQPVNRPIYKYLRRGGVKHFISYWGAPMSSIFGPIIRCLKRLEVSLYRHGPDHYIFESRGMADMAVLGRGIARRKTSVVYLGVDTSLFRPDQHDSKYVYQQFGIAEQRRVFFYAGHMEPRKGVAVIIEAANKLAAAKNLGDWHIVLFGNRPGEETPYIDMLSAEAKPHVLFGGYRNDLPKIQRGCYAAVIASTGWDSFPRSGMEMQASGLPLLASALPGLRESVAPGESGFLFSPGKSDELCELMVNLLNDPQLRDTLSLKARHRVEAEFSIEVQLQRLIDVVKHIAST